MSTHLSRIKSDKYLDKGEVRKVVYCRNNVSDLIKKGNHNKAYKLLIKYLEKYYEDGCLNYMMGQCLLKFRKYDEALIYFDNIPEDQIVNYKNYWLNVLQCNYFIGEYQKCLDILYKKEGVLRESKNGFCLYLFEIMAKKKLGISYKIPSYYQDSYIVKQLHHYSKEAAFQCITNKHIYNVDNSRKNSVFTEGIDLNYLFNLIQDNIDKKYFFTEGDFLKCFCVAIPNIGIYADNTCNFVQVVLGDNEKDIISIYPTMNPSTEAEFQCIDIDYDKLYPNKKDVNKMSKI